MIAGAADVANKQSHFVEYLFGNGIWQLDICQLYRKAGCMKRVYRRALEPDDYLITINWWNDDEINAMFVEVVIKSG